MIRLDWSKIVCLVPSVLFSWFAILALYASNIHGTTVYQLILPLLVTTLIIVVVQLGLLWRIKKWTVVGLLSLFLSVSFFSFSHLRTMAGQWLTDDTAALVVWVCYGLLTAFLIILLVRKSSWPSLKMMKLLTICGLVLLIGPISQIVPDVFSGSQARHQAIEASQQLPSMTNQQASSNQPDIYYIVLDRYASNQTQSDYYQHDNKSLVDFLHSKQFYIAAEAKTNYPKTLFSLSSTLNLDYLQNLVDTNSDQVSDSNTASTLLSHHKTAQLLKHQGYTYYHIGNYYELAATPEIADVNVMPNWTDFITTSSFARQLLSTTYYPDLAGLSTKYPLGLGFDQQYSWVNYQQQQLTDSVEWPGPKFVMAHFLMPHDPYVFNADCSQRQQPLQRWEASPEIYIEQLKCANQMAMAAIQNILDNSDTPPIIILQSDEGPEAMIEPTGHHWRFDNATDVAIKERTQILNAYYFPDHNYDQLYASITPVNSFRTIFRQYFNYDLPNLKDQTYIWPDEDHLFDFYSVESAP